MLYYLLLKRELGKASIKGSSPFYAHFGRILEEVKASVGRDSNLSDQPVNQLQQPHTAAHIQNNFMAYWFLWGGISLDGTGMTRATNGALENYQGQSKYKAKKNDDPSSYIVRTTGTVMLNCDSYLDCIESSSKKNKQPKRNRSEQDEEGDEGDWKEESEHDAVSRWKVPRRSFAHLEHTNTGFQRCTNTEMLETANPNKTKKATSSKQPILKQAVQPPEQATTSKQPIFKQAEAFPSQSMPKPLLNKRATKGCEICKIGMDNPR
jgi:hypothetical protein